VARWALVAAISFGLAEAAQIRLQTRFPDLPYQFLVMLPYIFATVALVNFGNAAANSGTSRFRSLGRGFCRPLGRRINDDLHTELAEGSHPRHLRQIGCAVDGNRKM
jgi:hypothetical protein